MNFLLRDKHAGLRHRPVSSPLPVGLKERHKTESVQWGIGCGREGSGRACSRGTEKIGLREGMGQRHHGRDVVEEGVLRRWGRGWIGNLGD